MNLKSARIFKELFKDLLKFWLRPTIATIVIIVFFAGFDVYDYYRGVLKISYNNPQHLTIY
jgi:hypothetical protein